MKTDLGLDHTVFGTCYKHEAFHLHEIGQFCGIQFADTDRVRFLMRFFEELSKVGNKSEIGR